MIKIENVEMTGMYPAIRGMRFPLNSFPDGRWVEHKYQLGEGDIKLASKLAKAGGSEAKYRRFIDVTMTVTAPLYWWKEFDTYKVGTVTNSSSTMHTLHKYDLTLQDFSTEHLCPNSLEVLERVIGEINYWRKHVALGEAHPVMLKEYWYQMIQLLPSSFNQRRQVHINYEVASRIYKERRNHKLDEWRHFCEEIEKLPYFDEIIFPQ